MRKLWVVGLIAFLALAVAAPVWAADSGDEKWHVHGDIRARADYFENFVDYLDVSNGGLDDNFGFWPFSVKVSIDGQLADNIHGFVELKNDETFGAAPTGNEFGTSPAVFSTSSSVEDNVHLYQAFIDINKIGGSNFSLRIGRQEHTLGTELLMGDNDFYTGQSFDGIRGWWNGDSDKWNVNLFYYKVFEENPFFSGGGSSDTNFMGATFGWKFDRKFGDLDVYYLRYQSLDNTGTIPSAGIDTIGARWGKMNMSKDDGWFDWNIEYANQSGDFGNGPAQTDLSADVIEGWFGVNFYPGAHHRVHLGYLAASGDDPNSTDQEAFFPLFNDGHAYNRLGNIDNIPLSDIQDISLGYDVWFGQDQNQSFMVALHQLKLDQTDTLTGEDDLGQVWDLGYGYKMTKNLNFEVGVSQHSGGNEQDALNGGNSDNAVRYYGQVRLTW